MAQLEAPEPAAGRWFRIAYSALLVIIGMTLAVGGCLLIAAGGSPYYLIAGLAVLASGMLIWRRDRRGVWLYGAMLVGTLGWSIREVGFETWLLVPRLVAPSVLGLGMLLLPVRRLGGGGPLSERVGGSGYHLASPSTRSAAGTRQVLRSRRAGVATINAGKAVTISSDDEPVQSPAASWRQPISGARPPHRRSRCPPDAAALTEMKPCGRSALARDGRHPAPRSVEALRISRAKRAGLREAERSWRAWGHELRKEPDACPWVRSQSVPYICRGVPGTLPSVGSASPTKQGSAPMPRPCRMATIWAAASVVLKGTPVVRTKGQTDRFAFRFVKP